MLFKDQNHLKSLNKCCSWSKRFKFYVWKLVFNFENQKVYITRSGYTGEDGFEISIPNKFADKLTRELIDKGSKLIGLGARDTLRLEAGLCLIWP